MAFYNSALRRNRHDISEHVVCDLTYLFLTFSREIFGVTT